MKKNMAMRAAGGLFVATMLTTSMISGTYAKYVTEGGAEDTARVAVFGVTVGTSGALFSETYTGTTANNNSITVQSNATYSAAAGISDVVAPGTNNGTGLTLSVAGTPEVDVQVTYTLDPDVTEDIFLAKTTGANTYPDMTTADTSKIFTLDADYHPIQWTLTVGGTEKVKNGTLDEVETALATLSSAVYDAGTNLGTAVGDITLKWEWAFTDAANPKVDKADTLLGDLAARDYASVENTRLNGLTADTDYSLETAIAFTVTVTQVD